MVRQGLGNTVNPKLVHALDESTILSIGRRDCAPLGRGDVFVMMTEMTRYLERKDTRGTVVTGHQRSFPQNFKGLHPNERRVCYAAGSDG